MTKGSKELISPTTTTRASSPSETMSQKFSRLFSGSKKDEEQLQHTQSTPILLAALPSALEGSNSSVDTSKRPKSPQSGEKRSPTISQARAISALTKTTKSEKKKAGRSAIVQGTNNTNNDIGVGGGAGGSIIDSPLTALGGGLRETRRPKDPWGYIRMLIDLRVEFYSQIAEHWPTFPMFNFKIVHLRHCRFRLCSPHLASCHRTSKN
eukprot:TRINITY_DN1465_c0_g1_i4.p2 TRINITY_DN1465_c0_g1~~TRINITY_DN1465_c0_g1_i4.p2  ORF type:complete len:209 (+),score=29.00 TRINITY_DN1465_c0_g1_i4:680-1306(+)